MHSLKYEFRMYARTLVSHPTVPRRDPGLKAATRGWAITPRSHGASIVSSHGSRHVIAMIAGPVAHRFLIIRSTQISLRIPLLTSMSYYLQRQSMTTKTTSVQLNSLIYKNTGFNLHSPKNT